MRDIHPKFVIVAGCIRMAKVTFHRELVKPGETVSGGGWFHFNSEDNSFTFYGDSHDFGKASLADIKKAISDRKVGDTRWASRFVGHWFYYCEEISDIANRVKIN